MCVQAEEVAKELIVNLSKCNVVVQEDVLSRVSDWLESGGSFNDQYILGQLDYTRRALSVQRKFDSSSPMC